MLGPPVLEDPFLLAEEVVFKAGTSAFRILTIYYSKK
jgi:hypothetical protein